jgi:hypothetical protein
MNAILSREHRLATCFPGAGCILLRLSALALLLSGLFAVLLGVTGRFLPHDERFLGMTARDLCAVHGCRIVHFMIHDRVSFGGALIAVGLLYGWLTDGPLRGGEAWAWWLLAVSGVVGFASFFAYLGYGYLDTWHGLATLALLPCYWLGLLRTPTKKEGIRCLLRTASRPAWTSAAGLGRGCLLATAIGLTFGGLTIMAVGMTCVFVPQDLAFMDLSVAELHALNPRLVPLIAHDRAGFGGAVGCVGIALFFCVWCGRPSRGLWGVLALSGTVGFGAAVGVHPAVGYSDPVHLGPAVLGAITYSAGLALTFRESCRPPELRTAESAKSIDARKAGRSN